MKKVIYVPKMNILQLNKKINSAFRGSLIYLSFDDVNTTEFNNNYYEKENE